MSEKTIEGRTTDAEMPNSGQSAPDAHANPTFAERMETRAEKLALFLENVTKLLAYIAVLATWLVIGFIAWVATLIAGIIVLIAVMIIRLVAGLPVERETQRFLVIMRFWPDGFTSLARAFWSQQHHEKIESENEQAQPSYLFAAVRIIYFVLILYLLVCVYYDKNPFTYVINLPANAVIGVVLIALITIAMSYFADAKRTAKRVSVESPAPSTPSQELGIAQEEPLSSAKKV